MNPQETGIVPLEGIFDDKLYIELKKEFFEELNRKIRKYGINKIANHLNVSKRIITHWLSDGCLIRADILERICRFSSAIKIRKCTRCNW